MQIHTTLRHYGRVVRQHFIFIVVSIALCTCATGLISACTPPIYQARALLRVNALASNSNNDVYSAQALALDYALLVTSPDVLRTVAQKVRSVTVGQLQQGISDAPVENTQIIEIRVQAGGALQAAEIANTVASTFIQQQAAREMDRLQSSANQLTQRIAMVRLDLDAAQEYLVVLQNNHATPTSIAQQKSLIDTDQANYGLLLTSYSQLEVQKLQAASILSVAQVAQPPDRPVSPQILGNMLLAAAMSLLFTLLLVLLLDWLDTTIKTEEDVVNLAGLKPLGCVPACYKKESTELLNLAAQSAAHVREALSMLGMSLRAELRDQRLLLVSGTRAGVGTSTVAVYLSIALARAGIRVLLLDTNLRQPLLHQVFQIPNANGLSNRLGDIAHFHEQPETHPRSWLNRWKTPVANLWLLPAGPQHSRLPAGIRELAQLRAWLMGEHELPGNRHMQPLVDLIICDTPPLGDGGDTYALSMLADGIVMVIEAGKEQREMLCDKHTLHLKAPILGVVVNRQKPGQASYYYVNQQGMESAIGRIQASTPMTTNGPHAQTPTQYGDEPAHQKPTAGEVPGIRFATSSPVAPRRIAERSMTEKLAVQPEAQSERPLLSASRRAARVTPIVPPVPQTPALSPLPTLRERQSTPGQANRAAQESRTQFKAYPK
ncbi:MAG: hypothetical protein PVS3B1_25940 [Ktedonobacteraceae bacterium]